MKTSIFYFLTILLSLNSFCQNTEQSKKPSPPVTLVGKVGKTNITINYSSPSVKGRKIWGGLVPYGQVWRTGANEATTFTTDKDIKVEGQILKAGTYSFFTIPEKNEWTIIFNSVAKQWGAFKYEQKDDVLRVKAKEINSESFKEKLTYTIEKNKLIISWENKSVPIGLSN